jgi:hypothetical protein
MFHREIVIENVFTKFYNSGYARTARVLVSCKAPIFEHTGRTQKAASVTEITRAINEEPATLDAAISTENIFRPISELMPALLLLDE